MFPAGRSLTGDWHDQPQWRVLATGFAGGEEFFAAWHAWRDDPRRPRLLHYVVIEPHPVALSDLLQQASPELQALAQTLAAQWHGLLPGFHRFSFEGGRVLLTLCVGEVQAMLREQSFRADAVLLGPEAANLDTLKAVTRLCRRGAILVTDMLPASAQSVGWAAEGIPPLRPSGGMPAAAHPTRTVAARYEPAWTVKGLDEEAPVQPRDCIVIGAGLAGAAVAASLARRGWSVQVLDGAARPATGASGLPAGLLAPHQSPDDNLLSRLSRAGVRITLQEAARLASGIEWERTGALEWRGDDRRPLPDLGADLAVWSREATDAQKRAAGVDAGLPAWWHENAAWIEPAALVRVWLREPGVRFGGGHAVAGIRRHAGEWLVHDAAGERIAQAPLVVVAAALGSAAVLREHGIELHPVRGQVTWAPRGDDAGALPPFPVNGHGHFLPRVPLVERDAWITGSTYGRGDADTGIRSEDHRANLDRVQEIMPPAAAAMASAVARGETRSWAGVRCASSDRRPLAGEVAEGLWVSTAMGSRGLTFAALCGELVAARLHGEPLPVEARLAQALDVSRRRRPRPD